MKKIIQLSILLIISISIFGCKSKQQIAVIPGAHAEAAPTSSHAVESVSPVTTSPAEVKPTEQPQPVATSAPEQVRNEKFELDKEEKNTDAINQKYHVVVGSFKNRDNAKGLQRTLNSEGNTAIIVVNEHGMYRVLVASFSTYDEARARINQISDRFPDAWVLTQKQ